jgi:hypothetical protein
MHGWLFPELSSQILILLFLSRDTSGILVTATTLD